MPRLATTWKGDDYGGTWGSGIGPFYSLFMGSYYLPIDTLWSISYHTLPPARPTQIWWQLPLLKQLLLRRVEKKSQHIGILKNHNCYFVCCRYFDGGPPQEVDYGCIVSIPERFWCRLFTAHYHCWKFLNSFLGETPDLCDRPRSCSSFDTQSAPQISREPFDLEPSNFTWQSIPTYSTATPDMTSLSTSGQKLSQKN